MKSVVKILYFNPDNLYRLSVRLVHQDGRAAGEGGQHILDARYFMDITYDGLLGSGFTEDMYIWPGVDGIADRQPLAPPGQDGLHKGHGGRFPIQQAGGGGLHHRMHHVAVQLGDGRKGFEIPGQDGPPAEIQPAGCIGNPAGLEGAGICEGMALGGSGLLMGRADHRDAVHQLPMLRWGQGDGVGVLVVGARQPLDIAGGDGAAGGAGSGARERGELRIAENTGMWINAVKRGKNWIYGPEFDTLLKAGDVIFASGPLEGEEYLRKATSEPLESL